MTSLSERLENLPDRRPVALALAGGGPLGAVYEIGAIAALSEALDGIDFNGLDIYVGVSAGAFISAGLANGLTPATLSRIFIDGESAEVPFQPSMFLTLAFAEFRRRAAGLPALLLAGILDFAARPLSRGILESFQRLSRAIPTGIFSNEGVGDFLRKVFAAHGRPDDFRALRSKLFLVATDLDSGTAVAFGGKGFDDVPISRAIQASSALPGLFPPVEIGGRWYVDGALKKTLHASVALKEGARLVLCINPLVPFDSELAARQGHPQRHRLVDGGLPVVLAQTFRAIIHSRMKVGMAKYDLEYPGADVILFEPGRDDADMFFTNLFSYSSRRRLSEHAYRKTREELLRRYDELQPKLARHGISIDRSVLTDANRTLSRHMAGLSRRRGGFARAALQLEDALDRLEGGLKRLSAGTRTG